MNVFPFIEAEKAGQHDAVKRSCELLEVSRSAFYEWHQHTPSARQLADSELGDRIQEIYDESRGTYGCRGCIGRCATRVCAFDASGLRGSCAGKGLVGRCRRRLVKTTISDPDVVAVDLLKRTFGPDTVELDRAYVGDLHPDLGRPAASRNGDRPGITTGRRVGDG